MVTPELRFDEDGFLDLSVFPETEPDVHGHGPGVLDPALDADRRALDDDPGDEWVAGLLTSVLDPDAGAADARDVDALVPAGPGGDDRTDAAPETVAPDRDDEADGDIDTGAWRDLAGRRDGPGGAR